MSEIVTTNIETNKELKNQVDNIFFQLGINASEAINMFYNQVLINKGLPFEVILKPSEHLLESITQHKQGKTKKYNNSVDALKALKM